MAKLYVTENSVPDEPPVGSVWRIDQLVYVNLDKNKVMTMFRGISQPLVTHYKDAKIAQSIYRGLRDAMLESM